MNSINENELKVHVDFIASDLLKGRKLGEPGLELAGDYLVSKLEKMNVKPSGDGTHFTQSIGFMRVEPDAQNTFLKIGTLENQYVIPSDSIIGLFPHPENINYEGSIVFAGYGVIDSASAYNDFGQMDVRDKIVMIMSRSSQLVNTERSANKDPFLYETEYDKITSAYQKGAKAVLWVLDPLNKYKKLSDLEELDEYAMEAIYLKEKQKILFPLDFIIITQHTADLILKSSGKSLLELQKEINSTQQPASFEIKESKVNLQVSRHITDFKSSNIVGFIEGSDPVLKNEYVIYTAHYDHLGVDEKGNIYNGADDNGSGTAALIEIAEAFTKLPVPPKRSVVFAWTTAEEKGGIGSQYYTDHPLFPLEKTIVCINLDMIGRVKVSEPVKRWEDVKVMDSLFVISGGNNAELLKINFLACSTIQLKPDYFDQMNRMKSSDQYFFYKKGIPVLFYHTGFHVDMHSINDDIEKIDFAKIKRVGQLAFLVGFEIANTDRTFETDQSVKKAGMN